MGVGLRLTQELLLGRVKMDPQDVPSSTQGSRLLLKKSALKAYGCQGSCLGTQDPRASSSGFATPAHWLWVVAALGEMHSATSGWAALSLTRGTAGPAQPQH